MEGKEKGKEIPFLEEKVAIMRESENKKKKEGILSSSGEEIS